MGLGCSPFSVLRFPNDTQNGIRFLGIFEEIGERKTENGKRLVFYPRGLLTHFLRH